MKSKTLPASIRHASPATKRAALNAVKPASPAARSNTWGTSHFVSRAAAVAYYADYEGDAENIVDSRLAAGGIHIGPPDLKPGQTLSLHREERRYFITETAAQS